VSNIRTKLIKMARDEGAVQALVVINHWLDALTQIGEGASEEENRAVQVLYNPIREAMVDIANGDY
jgi:hypothetical protein